MFKYCPSCASTQIQFEGRNKFFCPACGFVFYHNTAAATGCIITRGRDILVLVRGMEPARGKLDFPGGFVDPGEGVFEGLRRECLEELGWEPDGEISLFASFPNIYTYRGIAYNTCDLFFTTPASGLTLETLKLNTAENTEARFVDPCSIDPADIAFDSARRALAAFIARG